MHCLVVTRQIGHYHNARFRAAATRFSVFTVLSSAGEGFFAEFVAREAEGYRVQRLAATREDYKRLVVSGSLADRVAEILDAVHPDVIAASGWASAESYAALAWASRNRVPIVVMADSQYDDAPRSRSREALKGHLVKMFDAGFAAGPATRDYFARLGMAPGQVTLGYDAVDNAYFASGADSARAVRQAELERHGLPARYLLASGRFVAKKNFAALVRAYAAVRREVQGATPDLVILGDGPLRAEINAAAVEAGVPERVHLPGFRGYDALPTYYGLAEGFIHVPLREQWGLVINEAMAAGLPVVASIRCGAARTLMADGRSGFAVEPTCEDEIARAIGRLIALSPDDRCAMGQMARADVADWGPDRFASGLSDAVAIARERKRRKRLAPWDVKLLEMMACKVIDDVT